MPGWVPMSIGLEGMLSQLSASSTPAPPISRGDAPPGFESGDAGADLTTIAQWFLSGIGVTGVSPPRGYPDPRGGGAIDLTGSPTDQLAQLILHRMGTEAAIDPRKMSVAQAAAQRAKNDAAYRYQLAQWLGWEQSNPHVQYWIASGGGLPSNPTEKVAAVPSGGKATGTTPTPRTDPSAGKVPMPFDYKIFSNPDYHGYNYGDQAPPNSYKSGWHEGQDYGVPNNTPIMAPFAGKVRVGYEPSGYGNYVDLVFGNQGNYLRFAHLGYVSVRNGQTISPGTQLALSGSTGYSTGPHLLIEERNARNQPIDPRPLLSAIYNNGNGQSFAALETAGVAETGTLAPPGTSFGYEVTPDGHILYAGTPDRAYYDMVNTAYQQRYGVQAPYSLVMAMKAAGVQNTSQMAAVAANWPSDIAGMTFGQRDQVYNTANSIALKNWNRPIPDSLVKRLAAQGLTAPDDIRLWFDSHLSSDIPAAEYQQIYDAANPAINQAYGEPPAPDYIGYLWGQTQAPPSSTTPTTTKPPGT